MDEEYYEYDVIKCEVVLDDDRDPEIDEKICDYLMDAADKFCKGRHHWWQFWRKPGCTPVQIVSIFRVRESCTEDLKDG